MDMCYNGTLVMPSSYVMMDENEMRYVDGGTSTVKGTAKSLKNQAAALMASWFSLASGYTYGAASAAATGAGIPISVLAGIGAGYCGFVGNEYRNAYNYFATKNQKSTTKYKMTTITLACVVTGVTYGKA